MATEIVSADYLRSILAYDADTGVFTRLARTGRSVKVGDVAGCNSRGYIVFNVLGRLYSAHRLAWLYVTGAWPAGEIDHIDGNPGNNAIANLRDVPRNVNAQNMRRARSDNINGFMGVARNGKRWRAQIKIDGKQRHLGTHDTPELAHAAYLVAKRSLHEGCTI